MESGSIIRNGVTYSGGSGGDVTGVKGDKETKFRTGDVNLTAQNVGALPIEGGRLTGRLYETKGSLVDYDLLTKPHYCEAEVIAEIEVSGSSNPDEWSSPIVIEVSISGFESTHKLYLSFIGTSSNLTPRFECEGPDSSRFHVRRRSNNLSIFDVWFDLRESPFGGYANITVVRFSNPNIYVGYRCDITLRNVFVRDLYDGEDYSFGRAPTVYAGDKAQLRSDGEGGNLSLFSPNGALWEIDAHLNDFIRIYSRQPDGELYFPFEMFAKSVFNLRISNTYLVNEFEEGDTNGVTLFFDDRTYGRRVFLGTANKTGDWFIFDQTNKKSIIHSKKDGTTIFYGSVATSSSRRYKENIEPMSEERAKRTLDVEIVTFDYKEDYLGSNDRLGRSGVIVEDALENAPEVVLYDEDGTPDSVDYSCFIPSLIKMVQTQQNEIAELKAENERLSRRIARIEEQNGIGEN